MYQVVKQLKSSFAIFSALFITVITSSRARAQHTCGTHAYLQCSKPLSLLDNGLTSIGSKSDLDRICPDLRDAIRCIHSFTRKCMNLEHRRHFRKLFRGTDQMVHELCHNGTYQEEYLKYAPCMKEVAEENNQCLVRYSETVELIQARAKQVNNASEEDVMSYQKRKREVANEVVQNVCCAFQEFVGCSTDTMRMSCGNEAAEFSRKFLDRMSSSMLQIHCSDRTFCDNSYSSSSSVTSTGILLAALSVVIIYLR